MKQSKTEQMYIYNIGYHTYEESDYEQLSHTKKFSQKEFEDIVIAAAVKVLLQYEKKEKINFQDILHEVVDELIQKYGFSEINFAASVATFGWADIFDKKDWKNDRDEFLNRLTSAVQHRIKKNGARKDQG